MDKNKDVERNRPADEGRDNDPNVRDYQGTQPGVSTISSSDSDEANQHPTRTAADNFREDRPDEPKPDKRFDE